MIHQLSIHGALHSNIYDDCRKPTPPRGGSPFGTFRFKKAGEGGKEKK